MTTSRSQGQGAIEYVLLLAGILLVVILAILILRGELLSSANRQLLQLGSVWGGVTNATTALQQEYELEIAGGSVSVSTTDINATVSWETTVDSNSTVECGTTVAYGTNFTNAAQIASHFILVTGLSPNTAYHCRAWSCNEQGCVHSDDIPFTTLLSFSPPVISGVIVGPIASTTATVNWSTDSAANSTVRYGLTAGYGSIESDASLVTDHSLGLSGLDPSTPYHYSVTSCNATGCASTADASFTTLAGGAGPVISGISAAPNATNATISWTTDVNGNSTVEYGTTTGYGTNVTDPLEVTSHSFLISPLSSTTFYHYKVWSCNAFGCSASSDHTFTTLSLAGTFYNLSNTYNFSLDISFSAPPAIIGSAPGFFWSDFVLNLTPSAPAGCTLQESLCP